MIPTFVRWKNLKSKRYNLRSSYHRKILKETIQDQYKSLSNLKKSLSDQETILSNGTTWFQNLNLKYHAKRPMDKKIIIASQRHERKFKSLLREHSILTGITDNPNDIITIILPDRH